MKKIDTMPMHSVFQLKTRVEGAGIRLSCFLTTPVFASLADSSGPIVLKIQRKRVTGFTWGQQYEEHFDGLTPDDAETIFEGLMEPINRRKFEYTDTQVEIGETYAYWCSTPLGRLPTGPAPVRMRDHRIWWPHHEVETRLAALQQANPSLVRLKKFGTTVGGRSIPGLIVGNSGNCIALVGTIHAGESGPELMIPAVERLLAEHAGLLDQVGVALLPNTNIDERERLVEGCPWYLRTNARGVDINRNFNATWKEVGAGYGYLTSDPGAATYRGPRAMSEPETRAIVGFLKAVRPRAVLSYHALASITGACFLAASSAKTDPAYMRRCMALFEPFAQGFYGKNKRPRGAGVACGTSSGSLPAYAYRALGIPGFDLEWDGNPDAKPSHADQTSRTMLGTYQRRHYRGLVSMLQALCPVPRREPSRRD